MTRWNTPQTIYKGGKAQQAHNYAAGYRALEFRRPDPYTVDPDTGEHYRIPTPYNRIPTKVTPREMAGMVRNMETAMRNVPESKVREAQDWYARAHEHAHHVGRLAGFHGDEAVRQGAGIIAAMSPSVKWDDNVEQAKSFARTGVHGDMYTGYPGGGIKAQRIRSGEDIDKVLGPMKTGHFAHNLIDPEDSSHVTVDTHQHNAAVGWKHPWRPVDAAGNKFDPYGLGARSRYDIIARATQHVARSAGLPAPVAQSVIWHGWKAGNTGWEGSNYPVRW